MNFKRKNKTHRALGKDQDAWSAPSCLRALRKCKKHKHKRLCNDIL